MKQNTSDTIEKTKCLYTRLAVHMARVEDRDRVRVRFSLSIRELRFITWLATMLHAPIGIIKR